MAERVTTLAHQHEELRIGQQKAALERTRLIEDVAVIKKIVVGDDSMAGGLREDVREISVTLEKQFEALRVKEKEQCEKEDARKLLWKRVAVFGGLVFVLILPKHGPEIFAFVKSLFL